MIYLPKALDSLTQKGSWIFQLTIEVKKWLDREMCVINDAISVKMSSEL